MPATNSRPAAAHLTGNSDRPADKSSGRPEIQARRYSLIATPLNAATPTEGEIPAGVRSP
jgi:hypothetical protein